MNQSRLLLGVLLLSLFSFGLFQIGSSVTGSSVLGDSTLPQQNPVIKADTIPCEVISTETKSYCTDPQNWLLCKTLNNNLNTYCPSPSPPPVVSAPESTVSEATGIKLESYSAGPVCETDPSSLYSVEAVCSDGFSQTIGDSENTYCSSLDDLLAAAESFCTGR